MNVHKKVALAVFAAVVIVIGAAGGSLAGEPPRHVVDNVEIQARIDQQVGQAEADRQMIQVMLQRDDVRQIAGAAGLDIERASASAAVLSGPSLEMLAAQTRDFNASIAGGDSTVVISATAIIIILLILILLLR